MLAFYLCDPGKAFGLYYRDSRNDPVMGDAVVNEDYDEDVDDDDDDDDEWVSAFPASEMPLEAVDLELPIAPAGKLTIVEITSNLLRQVEELEKKLQEEKTARVATQAQLDIVSDAYANANDRLAQLAASAPAPEPPAPPAPEPPAPSAPEPPAPPPRPYEPSGPITAPHGYPHQAVWYCKGKAPPTGWKYRELRKTCRLIDHIYRRFPRKVVAAAGNVKLCKAYEEATTTMTYNGCFCRRQGAQSRSRIFVNAAQFFADQPGTAHNILCTIAHEYAHAVTYAEGNGLNHDDHFVRAEIKIRGAAFRHFYGEKRRRLW